MLLYRERLWPAPWVFLSTALVIPASLLVFLPINATVGFVTAGVLYAGCVALLLAGTPTIAVSATEIHAGRAVLPIRFAGDPQVFAGAEATLERGQRLDACAWLMIRGWISPVVKVPVTDPGDPAPYWLISSRRPGEFAAAVTRARQSATGSVPD